MPFVQRRINYAKVGKGYELIEHLHQGSIMARGYGAAIIPRVFSDSNSGRTDRVVMEWEAESVEELVAALTEMFEYAEGPAEFREWFERLVELIDYAEVETWRIH